MGANLPSDWARRLTHQLVHHDLIAIESGDERPGIYWLRLFRDQGEYVAAVTEVPGNPSQSITNATEKIARYIRRGFEPPVERLTLFEIWPRGALAVEVARVQRVQEVPDLSWSDASRSEIEALIAGPMPDLPVHDELQRHVVNLGGGVILELWRPHFEAMPVLDLPGPHEPFKCKHKHRFKAMKALPGESEDALGRRFLDTLTKDDIEACAYHASDWRAIAHESVRILEKLGDQNEDAYIATAGRWRRRTRDGRWLVSLFSQPDVVTKGAYSDGQHRGCALRFSGAARAAVATRYELAGRESGDWIYVGEG